MAEFESFDEWYNLTPEGEINIWDRLPGSEFLDEQEREQAFQLFFDGFVDRSEDADDRRDARLEFAEFMGYDYEVGPDGELLIYDFPWAEWAEWMGYEQA